MFEAAVDHFGRAIGGVGVVEVGEDVPGSAFERSAQRVTTNALAPAASTPPILTHYLAGQDGPIIFYTLTHHFQS